MQSRIYTLLSGRHGRHG